MAYYKFYTNKTIHYMEYAFHQINQTKTAFKDTWPTNAMIQRGKNGYFNFLKQHIISYYPEQIKYYRSATDFTTGIRKAIYIILNKDFFK